MISSDFPPIPGGQSKFLFNLWSNLPSDEIIVLAPKIKNWKLTDSTLPFKVIRLNLPLQKGLFIKSIKTLLLLLYTIKLILFRKVDRIHCGQVLSAGFVGYICHFIFKTPYFPYVHGADFLEFTTPFPSFKRRGLRGGKKILNLILKNASLIIANSNYTKNALIGFGILERKIIVINPSVDYRKFSPTLPSPAGGEGKREGGRNAEELKENYGLKDKKVLLTVGRLVERKGHDYVIKALPDIIKEIPEIHYLIVGDGVYRSELERLSVKLNIRDFITFAGFIPDEELPEYYAMCDVFIMASREIKEKGDVEGFGIVYLEANAMKKPVIAGRSGGISDAVEDGVNGILVNPTDEKDIARAIIKLMKDDEMRIKLGKAGYKRVVEKFSPERQAELLYRKTFQ